MFAAYESKMLASICAMPAVYPPCSHWLYGSSSVPHGPQASRNHWPLSWQLSVTLPAYLAKLDGETSEPIEATNHQRMRISGTCAQRNPRR